MTLNEILTKYNRKMEDITKIYRGLDHHCRCGCGGVYHYAGSRGMKMAITKMNKETFMPSDQVDAGPNYINIPYDYNKDLCYCVYFD